MKTWIQFYEYFKALSKYDRKYIIDHIAHWDAECIKKDNTIRVNLEQRRQRQRELENERFEIFKSLVTVGDVIRCVGTRDTGYRIVAEIKPTHVIGWQLRWNYRLKAYQKTGLTTQNGFGKIAEIIQPEKIVIVD